MPRPPIVLRQVVVRAVSRTAGDVRLSLLEARRKLMAELKARSLRALDWRTYVDPDGNAVLEVEAEPA
jgi:hypothetical protein